MRVITGLARGVPLATLPGEDVVRPTSQRVKEAMFSAVQFEIAGRAALDAFAGSGQLGIEALSRGAASCVFLEQNAGAVKMIAQNLERCKLADKAKLMPLEALQYMRRTADRFGIIFLDPPYGQDLLGQAIQIAAEKLEPGGLLVCEANARESLPEGHGDTVLRKEYKHGKTKVYVYQRAE